VRSVRCPRALDGSSSLPAPGRALPAPGALWGKLKDLVHCQRMARLKMSHKIFCVIFAGISHPEWDAGERRVEGQAALVSSPLGHGMR